MPLQWKRPLHELEDKIGYRFQNIDFLKIALTHSSYANESKDSVTDNERQEFLGDAVLSIIVSDFLFRNFEVPEGELTRLRAGLVCEQSLFEYSQKIELGSFLALGHGEAQNGGAERPSILADAMEAMIAAIYLDSGLDQARRFIIPFIEDLLTQGEETGFQDYKTMLQELIQQEPDRVIQYQLVGEEGPDHAKEFLVELFVNQKKLSSGRGKSKKIAEQQAAQQAWEKLHS